MYNIVHKTMTTFVRLDIMFSWIHANCLQNLSFFNCEICFVHLCVRLVKEVTISPHSKVPIRIKLVLCVLCVTAF